MVITTIEAIRPKEYVSYYLWGEYPGGNYVLAIDKHSVARLPSYLLPRIDKTNLQESQIKDILRADTEYLLNAFWDYLRYLNLSEKMQELARSREDLVRKAIEESSKDMALTFFNTRQKGYILYATYQSFKEKYRNLLPPELMRFADLLSDKSEFPGESGVKLELGSHNPLGDIRGLEVEKYGYISTTRASYRKPYLFDECISKLESMLNVIIYYNFASDVKVLGLNFVNDTLALEYASVSGASTTAPPPLEEYEEFKGVDLAFSYLGERDKTFGLTNEHLYRARDFLKKMEVEEIYEIKLSTEKYLFEVNKHFSMNAYVSIHGKPRFMFVYFPKGV